MVIIFSPIRIYIYIYIYIYTHTLIFPVLFFLVIYVDSYPLNPQLISIANEHIKSLEALNIWRFDCSYGQVQNLIIWSSDD